MFSLLGASLLVDVRTVPAIEDWGSISRPPKRLILGPLCLNTELSAGKHTGMFCCIREEQETPLSFSLRRKFLAFSHTAHNQSKAAAPVFLFAFFFRQPLLLESYLLI
jgi:hypothetical protein